MKSLSDSKKKGFSKKAFFFCSGGHRLPKEERDENQLTEWDEVLDDDEIEAGSISQSPIEISIKQVLIM